MVPARRASINDRPAAPPPPGDAGYDAGGEIGRIHAELARRLGSTPAGGLGVHIGDHREAVVRRVSVAAGYGALAAGYVLAAAAIYWA